MVSFAATALVTYRKENGTIFYDISGQTTLTILRYANMDFILFQTLAGVVFRRLLLSYDIACQYSRHLFSRMKHLPSHLQLPEELTALFDFVIPKFHLYGHGSSCQLQYSINLLPGCAHSDLEDPERWWAHINPVSMLTKLMTPWARRETIDDHARGWNWRKITQFGRFCCYNN